MNAIPATRQRVLGATALLMLAVYAVLSVIEARGAQQRLAEARRDLAEVARMVGEIDRLKRAPKVAALQLESPDEIINRIAAARQAAGMPQSSLLKEQPQDPQRIQRSEFELRSTEIDLAPASLPQILQFCDALRDEETGSVVRDMTLIAPQEKAKGGAQETWETRLILTQMIFSPKSR
jgi:hypothetical protein